MTTRKSLWKSFVALGTSAAIIAAPCAANADVDEVNTTEANRCAALSGKPGVAFSIQSARKLRDAAEILLPACVREKSLLDDQLKIKQLRIGVLTEINGDLDAAIKLRKEEAKELRAVRTGITSSPVFWLVVGLVVGCGATVGIGYSIRGAAR